MADKLEKRAWGYKYREYTEDPWKLAPKAFKTKGEAERDYSTSTLFFYGDRKRFGLAEVVRVVVKEE